MIDIKAKLERRDYVNEEHVRLSLVARILQGLDWNIWDPKEVNAEFVVVPHEDKTRVDLALLLKPTIPSVFVEIKPVGQIFGRLHEIERQLRDYNRNNAVLFSIITDGREWRFYYSQTGGEFAQKCFETLDLIKEPRGHRTFFRDLLEEIGNRERQCSARSGKLSTTKSETTHYRRLLARGSQARN